MKLEMRFACMFVFAFFFLQSTIPAEVVYDNMPVRTSYLTTTEVGDTVTLGGSKRFINSFSAGLSISPSAIGRTDDFILRFYLPYGPDDSPGKLIWQSPPLIDVPLITQDLTVTFDVPELRVPDTFIWSLTHGDPTGQIWFCLGNPPTIGSSPSYAWTNLTKFTSTPAYFLAKIEASDRSDAVLLGSANYASLSGIGTQERNSMDFNLYARDLGSIKGPSVAGITEWDKGSFPSCRPEDYPEFIETLTNGLNDTISVRARSTLRIDTEDNIFVKPPGIADGAVDFYGCIIKDIVLKLTNIVIDYSTPGWTYYTWDITWEIWGLERTSDFNRDGKVNKSDLSILSSVWDSQPGDSNWNELYNIALPPNDRIDELDLRVFCSDWLDGCYGGFDEGFETGDFSGHPWQHFGDSGWQVVGDTVMEGAYSARSGSITHNQESALEVSVDVQGTQITFYRKVSSETNFDYLYFYIDGIEQERWSGESGWSQVSYPVTAGPHIFKWSYKKDFSVSTGSDSAWIDQIVIN